MPERTTAGGVVNLAIIDVTRGSLFRLSSHLTRHNAIPAMWMGYAQAKSLPKVAKLYPNCEIYEYWRFNKGASFFCDGLRFSPDHNILASKEFLVLKDMSIKMMDRQDKSGRFRRQEREALFYSLFCFFYSKIKEKEIDLMISAHSPHLPATMIYFGVCKLLGVKSVHIREVPNAPLSYLATDFYDGYLKATSDESLMAESLSMMIEDIKDISEKNKEPSYMLEQRKTYAVPDSIATEHGDYSKLRRAARFTDPADTPLTYTIDAIDFLSDAPSVSHAGKDSPKGELKRFKGEVSRLQWNEYAALVEDVDLNVDYVFFPLHYEPEKTSNPDGGDYYNSYEAIMAIRDFVPQHIPIYIKEHITQFHHKYNGYLGRSPYFYRAISNLPNMKFVDSNVPARGLIEGSMLTVSQTGTASLEAACIGKKSMVMGDVWFSSLPNVFRFREVDDFELLMKERCFGKEDVVEEAIRWIRAHCVNGYVTGSFIRMHNNKFQDKVYLNNNDVTCRQIVESLKMNGYI